jgi:Flp pilus assembly protein TadG
MKMNPCYAPKTRHNMNRQRRTICLRRGAAAVEFALCVPILFTFVFGIIEISRMAQIQHTVREAALEGARAGVAIDAVTADVMNKVTSITGAVGIVSPTITVTPNPITYTSPTVSVTVSADSAKNGWLMKLFTVGQPITGSITMTREVQAVSVP